MYKYLFWIFTPLLAYNFAVYESFIHESMFIREIRKSVVYRSTQMVFGGTPPNPNKKYPLSQKYYNKYLKRVEEEQHTQLPSQSTVRTGNSKNVSSTTRNAKRVGNSPWLLDLLNIQDETELELEDDFELDLDKLFGDENDELDAQNKTGNTSPKRNAGLQIIINTGEFGFPQNMETGEEDATFPSIEDMKDDSPHRKFQRYQQHLSGREGKPKKSEHYEVVRNNEIRFSDIGGYESVKRELGQCVDILKNHTKYSKFNVRVPKGLIFEGPPGTGKTLLAKALAGEADVAFIAVSGSEFQEKYVGVGPMRVRELFALAKNNKPCIVFIDEIDALGRKRSSEGEASSERDNTLNELLVSLDGFKNTSGIFMVGATNRIDLLDPALIRPGRIDKRIHIGYPDATTRKAILKIHTRGKPCDISVNIDDLVEITSGMSGAQIENLVNEALLNALRENREYFTNGDIEVIMNKMLAGWQPIDHQFNDGIIHQIAIHEMGHSIVGLLSKHHSKMRKVIINLSSPTSPAYTVFEASTNSISTREALFEHLMILLAGRIAEEIFFEASVSTGAINDFEEALKLAERMILYYGMGKEVIYPSRSEKYKEIIDVEIAELLNSAYGYAEFILKQSKDLILEGAEMLKRDKLINANTLVELMNTKYPHILNCKIQH
jgi:cell division protease FtsH